MTLSIRNPRAEQLARDIALQTHKPITTVVVEALEAHAAKREADKAEKIRKIQALIREVNKAPIKDPRSSKEIMDDLYDEHGLPK